MSSKQGPTLPDLLWLDADMNRIQLAALAGEHKVKPVVRMMGNQIRAIEDYLKERRVIQEGFDLKEFGIINTWPPTPVLAKWADFKQHNCRVDPSTIPVELREQDPEPTVILDLISPFDLKLAKHLIRLRRVYDLMEKISARFYTCLDLERLRDKEGVDPCKRMYDDYKIVQEDWSNLYFHLRQASLLESMAEMLDAVRTEAKRFNPDDASAIAHLLRGMAMAMAVSNKYMTDHLDEMRGCIGEWCRGGCLLTARFREEDAYPWHYKSISHFGGLVDYTKDKEGYTEQRNRELQPCGMDLMGQ